MNLKDKNCTPLKEESQPFDSKKIIEFMKKLKAGWKVIDDMSLRKEIPFYDFESGMDFAKKVADLANEQNHHPELYIHSSQVEVELSSQYVGGLTLNDFIMAAKIDAI